MCLWTGLMKVAEKGGLTAILAKLFSPVMAKLFPDYEKDSPAVKAICMNITANLLGLGNAATPMGIAAMKEMTKARKEELPSAADNGMVMFVVINTCLLYTSMACAAILGLLVKTSSYRFPCSCFLRRASSREKGQPQNSCRYSPYSLESAMERL